MKKFIKLTSVALICCTLLFFVCCGSVDNDDEFGGGEGKTIVRFYSFNNTEDNAELKAALDADFHVKNPDIYVQTEISTGQFYTNVLNEFAGGIEADVFGMEPGEIYPFLQANYLEPLDSYFDASEKVSLDDIWEINKEAYSYNYETGKFGEGKTYAVMKDWTTDTMILYNRDLFSADQLAVIESDDNNDGIADPLTFDEFKTLATGLIKKNGAFFDQYGFLPAVAEAKALAQFITNAGLSWFDSNTYEANFNKADVQNVVKYYYDILGANEVNEVGSTVYPLFKSGDVAMVMGGLYCIDAYDLDTMNLGIAYPPVINDTVECKPYTTGCVGFAMSARSKVKNEAFKFIEWYLEYYAKKNGEKCNNFPAIKSAATQYMLNPEVNVNAKKLAATQIFYKSLEKAVIIDRNPYCSQMSLESIELTYAGEYLEGVMSLQQYCNTLTTEVNKRVNNNKPR